MMLSALELQDLLKNNGFKEESEAVKKLIQEKKLLTINFNSLEWQVEKTKPESILFYQLHSSDVAIEKWKERSKKNKSSLTFLFLMAGENNKNHQALHLLKGQSLVVIDEKNRENIQELLVNYFYPMVIPRATVAVTGTNGKTSTVYYARELCCLLKIPVLTLGTLGVYFNEEKVSDYSLTSAPFVEWRKIFYHYLKDKPKEVIVILEASSHGLEQDRFRGLVFDTVGFCSFSQDHLDYHQTMENYWKAKFKITNYLSSKAHVFFPTVEVNLKEKFEQSWNEKLATFPQLKNLEISITTTRLWLHQQLFARDLPLFDAFYNEQGELSQGGEVCDIGFKRSNKELALGLLLSSLNEHELKEIKNISLKKLSSPPGRMTLIEVNKNNNLSLVVIDFAHTPDALENICSSLKQLYPTWKLKVLFGCGGDRDPSKRPLMGLVVARYANATIYLTSDNPRSEDPEKIMEDILVGIKKVPRALEATILNWDRKAQLTRALTELGANEILLVAGKGHEKTIEIKGQFIAHQDESFVTDWIKNLPKG